MKIALYARVSTDRQRETHTVDSQLEALHDLAKQEGLTIDPAHVYVDDGYSGYYFDRPALDRLRDAARDGLIDLVLAHDPDRLARRYAYLVLLLEELERFGVAVRFREQPPPESPAQKLLVQIQGAISEYERARIVERTRRGRLYWARQGRPVCARVPYGYRYVPADDGRDATIAVDEANAEIVRRMFRWYTVDELSYWQIARRLVQQEVPTPMRRSTHWDLSSVRWILRNESYLGTWYLNRFRTERPSPASRPRTVERSRDEWIPISLPPLVDAATFCRARQLAEHRGSNERTGPKPLRHPETHLLRRLVVCGHCDRKMSSLNSKSGRGYRYYWCRGPDTHRLGHTRERCPRPTVLAPELDEQVWSDVVALLTDPDLLRQAIREQAGRPGPSPGDAPVDQQRRSLRRKLTDLERQRQRLLVAYEKGVIELQELTQRRNHIEQKTVEVRRHLDALVAEEEVATSIASLEQRLDTVTSALAQGLEHMDMPRRMKLCQQLIERVVVDGGSVEIHYRFPVTTNCNPPGKRGGVQLQRENLSLLLVPARRRHGRGPRRPTPARRSLPPVRADVSLGAALRALH